METILKIVFTEGKIFVGKQIVDNLLDECIECISLMTPDGRYMIIGNLIGVMTFNKDATIGTLSKDSMYYKNYFQTTSNVEIIRPNNFSSGKRIN